MYKISHDISAPSLKHSLVEVNYYPNAYDETKLTPPETRRDALKKIKYNGAML